MLEPLEYTRYGRHLSLPEVGIAGQQRLGRASVLVVGAGGLGSPVSLYLAAAGVGRLGLVDFDAVDLSNLQRQILYGTRDVGKPKLAAARERLADLNPHVQLDMHPTRLGVDNAMAIFGDYDIIVDGTDNFPTRYLVNDACVLLQKPNVYGSIFRFEGQVAVFHAPRGPCYRCLYPEPPPAGAVPNCAEGGVLGVLPGIIGALQATEAIKLILGKGDLLLGRLLLFDALEMRFRELTLRRDPACPICGDRPTLRELRQVEVACAPSVPSAGGAEIGVGELKRRIDAGAGPALLDVRTPQEWSLCRIEGARWIPLQEIQRRFSELDPQQEIVVYCHLGGRSAMAVQFLKEQGYAGARNLRGGIDAWASEIEPAMPRY